MVDRSRLPDRLWAALNSDEDATPSEAADHAIASESIPTRLVHVDVNDLTAAP